ncbi:hypothetical protein M9H77_25524 [Catharanthus roseus]|uniref:Uncharacterized protein n=1 Tax=Catharanthus roseus TaxID=4058 RepID=A0ACC0AB60_CATRO|nr:hypothetical protein M9H77_25524 [Catharanthus roseus]
MPMALAAPANGSDGRPRHRKGKGLTCSFMSVMSKIAGSRNKRPDMAREVPALTQKRKKGGPADLELILSYSGHVAGPLWRGQDRGSLTCRSCYMALTGMDISVLSDNENKLVDIRLRLDMMTADEVRWIPYKTQEIRACWVST